MQQNSVEHLGAARIQVVFHDRQASFRLSGNVTLGQIAATLGELSKRYVDRPLAIYVTMKACDS